MSDNSVLIPLEEARRRQVTDLKREEAFGHEPPRPLMRKLKPADPFPVECLGDVLGQAAAAIHDRVQAPLAICAQSVLASATFAVQSHADVVLPIGPEGQARPISNYFCTIAGTGERKSACDSEATRAIKAYEMILRDRHDDELPGYINERDAWKKARQVALKHKERDTIKAALDACGAAPKAPLEPLLLVPDPTYEGLCRLFAIGQPSLGLFAAEGGQFIGGYSMSDDNKLATAAGLSGLWDGEPIRRVRAGDGVAFLPGRRLTSHLMVQPDVAALMCSDPLLTDQGFLSRMLVSAPESASGTRFFHAENNASAEALHRYEARLTEILSWPLSLADGKQNELQPRRLMMSSEAQKVWREFADHVENETGVNGSLEPVKGLANKLPEHAARIAAVLTLVEDLNALEIGRDTMSDAINIAQHYAAEALRMFGAGRINSDLALAQKLLDHLHSAWNEELVSLPDIYQRTLNAIRDKATATRMVRKLVDHGWLLPVAGGGVVGDQYRRDVWRIVRR